METKEELEAYQEAIARDDIRDERKVSKPQSDTASEHERAMQWYSWRDSGCAW